MEHSQTRTSEVVRSERLGSDIFRLTVLAPWIAEAAQPGQFVMVQPADGQDPLLRRPFSIHQVTGAGAVQILFKVVGRGTSLLSRIRQGGQLNVIGPFGKGFALPSGVEENICLIGGGMGIAPLLFLAKRLIGRSAVVGCRLVALLGARTGSELTVLQGEFQQLGLATAIATDDGSSGHHGLVTQLMLQNMAPGDAWRVYTCGPHPMMRGVVEICQGMAWPCQVSLETMMACGMGACLGCAITNPKDPNSYLHVCKDGPVFEMSEVAWR